MRPARPPDWLVYAGVLLVLMFLADGKRPRADAPAPPPPAPGDDTGLLAPLTAFDAARMVRLPPEARGRVATAFSVGEAGVWLTAASAVEDCGRLAVALAPGRGELAKARIAPGGLLAVLTTDGGRPALPLSDGPARPGEDSFAPGYPHGGPGEAAVRLLGPATMADHRRGGEAQPVRAWVEIGRTDGLRGALDGMQGAPVLDGAGRVQGVLLAESPRRGRLYAAPRAAVRAAMAEAAITPSTQPEGDGIAIDNYGRAADFLRRDLRVVQVWCGR